MRVLLVSPADVERGYLLHALHESLNSVEVSDGVAYAVCTALDEPFDAIIVRVPVRGPIESIARDVRRFAALPYAPYVILILADVDDAECATLLRAGADVCFAEPCSVLELQQRMRVLQRSASSSAGSHGSGAQPRLDPLRREWVDGQRRVALTHREYLLLECLLHDADRPVPRERLIRYAWQDVAHVDPASVGLAISRLRRKLLAHRVPGRIVTVKRVGYRLTLTSPARFGGAASSGHGEQ